MLDQIAKVTGAQADPTQIAVFECIALNTEPISKRGSLWNGATVTPNTLSQMASVIPAGGSVPLHTLHEQGEQLPVGKVFSAGTNGPDELRALFFVPRNTIEGQDLIAKLNSGVVDEVSVGLRPKAMKCSACGWDYLGADATPDNIWDRTCANDHTIGEKGVHAIVDGLDRWLELSLVSLGAANNAKIVGRAKAVLGQDEYQRLAASGTDPEITTLFASPTHAKGKPKMADEMLALVASLSSDKTKAELALTNETGKVTDLTAKLAASQAQITDLTTKLTAATAASDNPALKEDHDKMSAFLSEATKSAMIASGNLTPTVPTDVAGMLSALSAATVKLYQLPVGGVALAAADIKDPKSAEGFLPASAFTIRK
ncbi:hypothetical protein [Telmatospirillum sp.]|uniref:hypothetical protein n=1 Tax=Telmatospirillum sp. TaxID=2079197 RepID=UPI00283B3A54|nr:hypothetical protein [Telmatospirillum sp.]MDR3436426.1 hypothetical protein [Telmatospirillum sp.]